MVIASCEGNFSLYAKWEGPRTGMKARRRGLMGVTLKIWFSSLLSQFWCSSNSCWDTVAQMISARSTPNQSAPLLTASVPPLLHVNNKGWHLWYGHRPDDFIVPSVTLSTLFSSNTKLPVIPNRVHSSLNHHIFIFIFKLIPQCISICVYLVSSSMW